MPSPARALASLIGSLIAAGNVGNISQSRSRGQRFDTPGRPGIKKYRATKKRKDAIAKASRKRNRA